MIILCVYVYDWFLHCVWSQWYLHLLRWKLCTIVECVTRKIQLERCSYVVHWAPVYFHVVLLECFSLCLSVDNFWWHMALCICFSLFVYMSHLADWLCLCMKQKSLSVVHLILACYTINFILAFVREEWRHLGFSDDFIACCEIVLLN